MIDVPFAFAFTAGLVATLNPCGFAMLPAYLSFFMGQSDGEDAPTGHAALRALAVGATVSAGFLAVFGIAGALITLGVRAVIDALPWLAMAVGIGIIGLGIAMLAGHELRIRLPARASKAPSRDLAGVFWFGVSYAIASLSCTLPVFLVVVAGTIPRLGFVAGVATFLVYGLGMAALLLFVTLSLALGKHTLVRRLRRGSAYVNRIAGGILILAGVYIVYFWVTTMTQEAGTPPAPVLWIEQLSSRATNLVAQAPGLIGTIAIVSVAAAILTGWLGVWRSRRGDDDPGPSVAQPDDGSPSRARATPTTAAERDPEDLG